MRYNMDALVAK